MAAGAFAFLLSGAVYTPVAFAQAAGAAAQPPAAGAKPQKNYKDRGEYDLYNQATQQAKDPKTQLQTLQSWQDKYPQTDFEQERLLLFINALRQLAATDPSAAKQLLDKANALVKLDPKNFQGNYFVALWGPRVGGNSAPPDLLTQIDTAAHGV